MAVPLKYGRSVAKCDPWIQRATQGPTMDGPFGDQWIIYVLQKIFRKKSGQTTPQMHWYQIHGLAQDCRISIANALEILQSCTKPSVCLFGVVWTKREYRLAHFDQFFNWFHGLSILLTDHPKPRRTTQPSIMGGPFGDPGFFFFRGTAYGHSNWLNLTWQLCEKVSI